MSGLLIPFKVDNGNCLEMNERAVECFYYIKNVLSYLAVANANGVTFFKFY